MDLYPAIDILAGAAVRLVQGDFDRETQYGDPLALAESYVAGGATWIHVVDLNAARTGVPHEREALEAIVGSLRGVRVQAGGGIRTRDDVEDLLALGAARVVLGTAALQDPAFATASARHWPGQVALGLDYQAASAGIGQVRSDGWKASSPRSMASLLEEWSGEPFGAVVATSIARDGMLGGSDLDGMRGLLELTSLPVIASGGVGTLDDLRALAEVEVDGRRLTGAIVGKALVEGRFTVAEAVDACAPSA
jgi:phosphoribosylformimino-5-aminoimidazole carboxamide ribotide isomerase